MGSFTLEHRLSDGRSDLSKHKYEPFRKPRSCQKSGTTGRLKLTVLYCYQKPLTSGKKKVSGRKNKPLLLRQRLCLENRSFRYGGRNLRFSMNGHPEGWPARLRLPLVFAGVNNKSLIFNTLRVVEGRSCRVAPAGETNAIGEVT